MDVEPDVLFEFILVLKGDPRGIPPYRINRQITWRSGI
jgi:hypothetical protein